MTELTIKYEWTLEDVVNTNPEKVWFSSGCTWWTTQISDTHRLVMIQWKSMGGVLVCPHCRSVLLNMTFKEWFTKVRNQGYPTLGTIMKGYSKNSLICSRFWDSLAEEI
jgi:hypothetical protein